MLVAEGFHHRREVTFWSSFVCCGLGASLGGVVLLRLPFGFVASHSWVRLSVLIFVETLLPPVTSFARFVRNLELFDSDLRLW